LDTVDVVSCPIIFFFFFSSRRRHTRWPRDWSSDVCSSDLEVLRVTSAERPHVLILDDAQWIDATSYQMIERLARDLAPAPVLIRSEERRVGKECRSRWSP